MKWVGVGCILAGIVTLCFLSYRLGMSNAKIQVIEKQVEVIKYVEKERAKIHSKPSASRIELLNRMRADQL